MGPVEAFERAELAPVWSRWLKVVCVARVCLASL